MNARKRFSKIMAMLIALAMTLTLCVVPGGFTQTARAAEPIIIDLDAITLDPVDGDGYNVDDTNYVISVYTGDTVTIKGDGTNEGKGWSIYTGNASNIIIEAGTTILGSVNAPLAYTFAAIYTGNSVTIDGGGSGISITGSAEGGIAILAGELADYDIEITGTIESITGGADGGTGIAADNVKISGTVGSIAGSEGTVDGGRGIHANGNIEIDGYVGSISGGNCADGYGGDGIYAWGGSVIISGTVGNVTGGDSMDNYGGYGIYARQNIEIESGATVGDVAGGNAANNAGEGLYGCGLFTERIIKISGEIGNVTGGDGLDGNGGAGIYAYQNIEIESGATVGDVAGGDGTDLGGFGLVAYIDINISGTVGDVAGGAGADSIRGGLGIYSFTGGIEISDTGEIGNITSDTIGINGPSLVISGVTGQISGGLVGIAARGVSISGRPGHISGGHVGIITEAFTLDDSAVAYTDSLVDLRALEGDYDDIEDILADLENIDFGDYPLGPTADSVGILFIGNSGTVYGNATLTSNLTVTAAQTLTIAAGTSLIVPSGVTLSNYGTIVNEGTITNNGTIYTASVGITGDGEILGNQPQPFPPEGSYTPPPTTNRGDSDDETPDGQDPDYNEDGSINLPGGNTVVVPEGQDPVHNEDGSTTLPGGGTITIGSSAESEQPQGTANATVDVPPGTNIGDDGTISFPSDSGGTITIPGHADDTSESEPPQELRHTTIDVPPGTTVTPEGAISFPEGSGGATITDGYGNTFNIPEGAVITLDPDAALGYTISIDNPFADVGDDDWYEDAILFAYAHGLMAGIGEDEFNPDDTTTRGMIVTVLFRMANAGGLFSIDSGQFSDVDEGMFYSDAVAWAASIGLVSGYGDGTFGVDDAITRQDLAVILTRFADLVGLTLQGTRDYTGFTDGEDIANYAADAIELFYSAGIISGYPDGSVNPQGTATRAEFATMLMRFLEAMR